MRIGELLVESKKLTVQQLNSGLDYAKTKALPIGRTLKMLRYLTEEELQSALKAQSSIRDGMKPATAVEALTEAFKSQIPFEKALVKVTGEYTKPKGPAPEVLSAKNMDNDLAAPTRQFIQGTPDQLLRRGDEFLMDDQVDEAERYYTAARQKLEIEHGLGNIAAAPAFLKIANMHLLRENFTEAEKYYLLLLSMHQKVYGTESMEVAECYIHLADMYEASQYFVRAEEFFLQAAAIRERNLPSALGDYLANIKKLILLSRKFTDRRQPRKLGQILIEAGYINDEQLQELLRKAKQSRMPLGTILKNDGMISHDLLQSVLEAQLLMKEGVLPECVTITTLKVAALQRVTLKQFLETSGLLIEQDQVGSLELANQLEELLLKEKEFGAEHPTVANMAVTLAESYAARDDRIQAEFLYNRAMSIYKKCGDQVDKIQVASASIKFASMLNVSGRSFEAQPILLEALDALGRAGASESEQTVRCLQQLGELEFAQDNMPAASNFFRSSVALAEKLNLKERIDLIQRAIVCYQALDQTHVVMELYEKLISAAKHQLGPTEVELADLMVEVGDFYASVSEKGMAQGQYECALQIYQVSHGTDPAVIDSTRKKLVEACENVVRN
jgi:tetratricopeptide (TPR) repeat protein